jgi:hypothetical protein
MQLQYKENQKTYLVTNGQKGILIQANSAYEAMKKGNIEYYDPYLPKNDMHQVQPYDIGKHCLANRLFKKVQFHTVGGVVTQYDKTIDAEPTKNQIDFLDRPIAYIKFFNQEY